MRNETFGLAYGIVVGTMLSGAVVMEPRLIAAAGVLLAVTAGTDFMIEWEENADA